MVTPKRLVEGIVLPNAVAVLYTAPGKTSTVLKKVTFNNADAVNAHAVTVYLVASGGAPTAANRVLDAFPVAPLDTFDATQLQNHVLSPGDTLQAFADDNVNTACQASGVEIV